VIRYAAAVALLLAVPVIAQSNNKGANSPIALGPITEIGPENAYVVITHDGASRKLVIGKSTKVAFVGMPEAARKLTVGYGVKGRVKKGKTGELKVTLPIGEPKSLGTDRHSLTEASILAKADNNQDGGIDYVEMSEWIYHSPKHGPDSFSKCDKNQDGLLSLTELPKLLEKVTWWKFSRKTAEEWFKLTDKDQNGSVSVKEFEFLAGKGHAEARFKRADADKNKSLSPTEIAKYVGDQIVIQ
jgi:Ca2+-binding EF-hand superfamily protein